MIDAREIPLLGAFGGAVIDLFATGGDTILMFLAFFVESIDLMLPLASRLLGLGDVLTWLPEQLLQTMLTWVTIVFVVVYAIRLLRRFRQSL